MKRGQPHWTRALRRAAALFLATLTVWLLSLTTDVGSAAAAFRSLAESPAFVSAALRAELGALPGAETEDPTAGLTSLERLILRQSPTLSAGFRESVSAPPDPGPEPTPGPQEDPEDPAQLPPAHGADEVVGRTMRPADSEHYSSGAGVYVENRLGLELDVAALAAAPLALSLPAEGPQVLIMHTHGSEAYTPDGADTYTATDNCRTIDNTQNVVRVGEEIKDVLTEMGLEVLHDMTLYDYPNYNGAYDRSQAAVERYLEEYPSIRVVMDVHRDALIGEDGTVYKPVTTIGGEDCAQVMLVMGTDARLSHPDWLENLSLAVRLQQTMNTLWPTLARPVALRESRYNQQLTTGSILVEVGSHGNTLQEALAAARMFARSAGAVLVDRLEPT